MENFRS